MSKVEKDSQRFTVTAAVRALRKSLGESQQQFAYRMDAAIRTLARYETTRPPKGKTLAHLKRIAMENGREDLAEVFAEGLAKELQVPPFSSFHLTATAKNQMEEFYISVMLAMLRNPQYAPLLPKFNRLAAVPLAESVRLIRAAEKSRSKWQQFLDDARKTGVFEETLPKH